jgi:phospholipid transport system substrate-binding protein
MGQYINIVCSLLLIAGSISADDPVKTLIMNKDRELKVALENYRIHPEQSGRESVIRLINSIFDFEYMGKKVLPKAVWDSISIEERAAFVKEFRRMIEESSVSKLSIYQSDSVFYNSTVTENSSAVLTTIVWYKGKSMLLKYKMTKRNDQWKAWDLVMDDLSTIRTYREQFTEILKTKKLSELTFILKKKADELSGSK